MKNNFIHFFFTFCFSLLFNKRKKKKTIELPTNIYNNNKKKKLNLKQYMK